jgi:hypothetical protein
MTRRIRDWSPLAAAFVAGGVLMSVVSAPAQDPPPGLAPRVDDAGGPALQARALAADQAEIARRALEVLAAQHQRDPGDPERYVREQIRWGRRLADATLAQAGTADERAAAITPYVERLEGLAKQMEALREAARASTVEVDEVRYELLEARRWRIQERGR